jgi:hypothetical protein
MPYTIKPKTTEGFGSFGVLVGDANEALNIAKGMVESGIEEVKILNEDGAPCTPVELERVVRDAEMVR